ncbi:hypothetical protein GGS26DRAFT_591794 [Hypomontagnella submonticulosa]|nr:hypothetical protein GGS26DRAFT_591794 [Hypomontagnella submonticulosa]
MGILGHGLLTEKEKEAKLQKYSWNEFRKATRQVEHDYAQDWDSLSPEAQNWYLIETLKDLRKKEKAKEMANDDVPPTPKRKRADKHKAHYPSDESEDGHRHKKSSKKTDESGKKSKRHH